MSFKFGTSTVPDGIHGDWSVSTFTVSKDDALWHNMRSLRNGEPYGVISPGTYKRLTHKTRGVIMSNTPMEIRTNMEAYTNATGRVLINGLGLGMLLEGILSKPNVTYIKVIEQSEDVIKLVGHHFKNDKRVEIVHGDAYKFKPEKDEQYDYVWHDIWDDMNEDYLPLMTKLSRKYSRFCKKQGFWSRDIIRKRARASRREASMWG